MTRHSFPADGARWICALSLGTLCALSSFSVSAEPALLTEAREARAESIPQVAIQKLRTLLKSADLPEETKRAANYELAAALLAADEEEEALWVVQPLLDSGAADACLLQADILAHAARWSEALPIYQKLSETPEVAATALLGVAESLQALGQPAKAAETLGIYLRDHPQEAGIALRLASLDLDLRKFPEAKAILAHLGPLKPADERWRKYVEGRILLADDQAAPALAMFEELLQDLNGVSDSLLFGATLGSLEARAVLNGYEVADGALEKFISRYPESPFLEVAFQRLDEVYDKEDHPSESELKKWAQKPPARRGALAQYYLARMYRRVRKPDKAASALDAFVQVYNTNPLLSSAYLLQADLFLEKNNLPSAIRALEGAMRHTESDEERAQIDLRTALVHYRQGESLLAANSFRRAAQGSSKLRQAATFDAALAALNMRNYDLFFENYRALAREFPESPLRSDLVLEEGFAQARAGDLRAGDTLELFLHNFPKHPRQNEARIALAELAMQDGDKAGAARYLQVVNTATPNPDTAERAAYLAVFLADAETPQVPAKIIELAQKFIREYPHSQLLPEIRMKLGQIYFRTEDHANAETQFTLLAKESPNSPYAETALFLAGQAATKWLEAGAVDRALGLFYEVVKRDGALKLYARQQQAIVKSKLGKEDEAIVIYDQILTAQPPPELELRSASLCGKGDNLTLLGRKDPKQLEAALEVYDSLAALPDVTPAWRNQALYKKGRALEQLGRQAEALTAYYDVLDKTAAGNREFFWYYKAGFDAAALFEKQEEWKSAIGIYQKMAQIEGPRAEEARARLRQLRLEKFIWD